MLKQITSWKHPVSSTVLNMEKDATFYEKYVLSANIFISNLDMDGLRWLDFNRFTQTPSNEQIRRLNILYNFIKLVNLLNPGSIIIFNRKGVPMLCDKNKNNITIILMCNHTRYYIKMIRADHTTVFPPYFATNDNEWSFSWEKRYTDHTVEQLLNIHSYEQFIETCKKTRLIPDILKIVYDYI